MKQNPILVPSVGHTEAELKTGGTKSFVSWDRILPDIKHKIMLKGTEEIVGLEVDEDGITVTIEYK